MAAHPHSFLDAALGLSLAEGRITGLAITWLFDEIDSEIAIEANDRNRNGKLDAAELAGLAERMQRVIAEQRYHTHLRVDGKPVPMQGGDGLALRILDGRLEVRFRIPLAEPIDPRRQKTVIGLYDDTYYIQFGFDAARGVTLDGTLPAGCKLETFLDRSVVLYEVVGSKVHATVTEIRCDP